MGRLSIRKFEDTGNLANREIFSEQDRQDIAQARKALVADSNDIRGYDLDANLLLMAFRVLSDHLTPFIKYRLSDDKNLRSRIMDVETHILLQGYRYESYTIQDFPRIDAVYMAFRQAEHVSLRLKNAFFFVYLAFTTVHWMESFLFHMNALEALFSKDERGPATKTITKRVSSFLDDTTNWSEKTISDLYEVRSRITHGNIEARSDATDNLLLNAKMELLTKLCLRKLHALDAFPQFATKESRDNFMVQFD